MGNCTSDAPNDPMGSASGVGPSMSKANASNASNLRHPNCHIHAESPPSQNPLGMDPLAVGAPSETSTEPTTVTTEEELGLKVSNVDTTALGAVVLDMDEDTAVPTPVTTVTARPAARITPPIMPLDWRQPSTPVAQHSAAAGRVHSAYLCLHDAVETPPALTASRLNAVFHMQAAIHKRVLKQWVHATTLNIPASPVPEPFIETDEPL